MCFCKGNGPGVVFNLGYTEVLMSNKFDGHLFFEKNYVTTACFILNDAESSQFIFTLLAWMGIY